MSELIRDIPSYLRPYEKARERGIRSLDDAELLAVILRTGNRGEGSVKVARRLLTEAGGSISGIKSMTLNELTAIAGIGPVKALQIQAVTVLAERLSRPSEAVKMSFIDAEEVAACYMEEMRSLDQEILKCIFLDSKNRLISSDNVSMGTVNSSIVPVREILVKALKYRAVNLILIHNHPSGIPDPSDADIEATLTLKKAAELTGIAVLDHIIIGDGRFISLHQQGIYL